LTGVFAQKALNGVADGMLFGNPRQVAIQATAVAAACLYSGVMSFLLLKEIGLVIPLRADASQQDEVLDLSEHGEEGYSFGEGTASMPVPAAAMRSVGHLQSHTATPTL
jgi:Amt family ammonium transporter